MTGANGLTPTIGTDARTEAGRAGSLRQLFDTVRAHLTGFATPAAGHAMTSASARAAAARVIAPAPAA
jgi:hypothetical protein